MRGGSNPGKIGHKWVKDRFVKGPFPFIPCGIDDNPYIDKSMYRMALSKLDKIERLRKLEGNWDIGAQGGLFSRLWFKKVGAYSWNDIEKVIRYWDLAATEKNERSVQTGNVTKTPTIQSVV